MKILQIFGAVVAVHLLAFIFIFASPGCQSGPRNIPTPDATVPNGSAIAPVVYPGSTPAPADAGIAYSSPTTAGHSSPTRPGSAAAVAISPAKPPVEVAPVATYVVVRGDSLWSIAQKNHLTVAELAKANSISTGTALKPGKKLFIPGKAATPSAEAPKDLATAASTATPAPKTNGEAVRHTVQSGESLGVIARKYQVSVGELAAANNITDPSKVRAGQSLVIPGFKAVNSRGSTTSASPSTRAPAQKSAPADTPAAEPATPETAPAAAPHFDLAPPPPGQDLDSGLKENNTEVPTIKVEEAPTTTPAKS